MTVVIGSLVHWFIVHWFIGSLFIDSLCQFRGYRHRDGRECFRDGAAGFGLLRMFLKSLGVTVGYFAFHVQFDLANRRAIGNVNRRGGVNTRRHKAVPAQDSG